MGRVATFLASPLASGVTASTVYVDKGYHSMGMAVDSSILPPVARVAALETSGTE